MVHKASAIIDFTIVLLMEVVNMVMVVVSPSVFLCSTVILVIGSLVFSPIADLAVTLPSGPS